MNNNSKFDTIKENFVNCKEVFCDDNTNNIPFIIIVFDQLFRLNENCTNSTFEVKFNLYSYQIRFSNEFHISNANR